VGGKPLIARTIDTARESQLINRIIVTTDDKEIARVAKEHEAEVFNRSEKLSNDEATSEAVLLDVLDNLKHNESYVPDITVLLQCTSPFTIMEDIDGTIYSLINNNTDSAFSATDFKHFLWMRNNSCKMVGINHNENIGRKPRQDLPLQHLETGSVCAFLTAGFLKYKNRFFGNISIYRIPDNRVFEIDTQFELEIANQIEKLMN